MKINRAFKYRLYPTREQQQKLTVQFGHARFVYNLYLHTRSEFYRLTGQSANYYTCANDLKYLKADEPWLKAADSQVLQQSLKHLHHAFQRFFKGFGSYPRFKSKFGKQSITYPQRFKIEGNKIYLPKVGWVNITLHRNLIGKMKSATVSKTKSGSYFVSILCVYEQDVEPLAIQNAVGIDLGLTDFVTLSTGEKIGNPRWTRRSKRRLKIRQRRLSRKAKGSNNRGKARLRLAKSHEKVANQRKDHHHKLSKHLVDRFERIALESLNISGMMKNHHLACSIGDAGWSQFTQQLKYKAEWVGGEVRRVDQWFPSSKTCSCCGEKSQQVNGLGVREWRCEQCGAFHDRDVNAAINILNQSTAGEAESNACQRRPAMRQSGQEAQAL